MGAMNITVLRDIEGGVEVGSEPCACGGCRPTATIYRDDPTYRDHDPKLAEGPCCCGRFFVVAREASAAAEHARAMAAGTDFAGLAAYRFERQRVALPWGAHFEVVVGDLRS